MTRRASVCGGIFSSLLVLVLVGSTAAQVNKYQGQVKAVKIEECQLVPGTCKGTVTLRLQDGREVTLRVEPDTVMVRADKRITIGELGVGNYIMARAAPVATGGIEQAWSIIQSMTAGE